MTTVINNPGGGSGEGSGVGVIVGVLVAIVMVVLFFVYVLPRIRNNQAPADTTNINVTIPSGSKPAPAY